MGVRNIQVSPKLAVVAVLIALVVVIALGFNYLGETKITKLPPIPAGAGGFPGSSPQSPAGTPSEKSTLPSDAVPRKAGP